MFVEMGTLNVNIVKRESDVNSSHELKKFSREKLFWLVRCVFVWVDDIFISNNPTHLNLLDFFKNSYTYLIVQRMCKIEKGIHFLQIIAFFHALPKLSSSWYKKTRTYTTVCVIWNKGNNYGVIFFIPNRILNNLRAITYSFGSNTWHCLNFYK